MLENLENNSFFGKITVFCVIIGYKLLRWEDKEMPTHSLDLRQRIVAAYQAGEQSGK